MTVAIIVLAIAVAAVPALWWRLNRPTILRSRLRHRVIVTLQSGMTFDGVLHSADGQAWVLRDARAVSAGEQGANVPVDGEVILLISDIDYAQRP